MTLRSIRMDLLDAKEHYAKLLATRGDTPQAVAWRDRATQERRMAILAQVGDLTSAKLLDFGCGTGHLLAFLRRRVAFAGEYVGYDLSPEMIAAARRKFPEARFEARDILAQGVPEDFDYVLISGVFNQRLRSNWELMTAILERTFSRTHRALAFNALSTYVDFFERSLFYVNPERVFRFCKERLSPCVSLRHDYLIKTATVPFEFTVYVYRRDLEPRKRLSGKADG